MSASSANSDFEAYGFTGTSYSLALRDYNCYRIVLSFFLLHFYINVPDQIFVGQLHPSLYKDLVYTYFIANWAIAVACFLVPQKYLAMRIPIFIIFCADIIFFGFLTYSSGGINGVLGNFLMVPVAFAGAMVLGRVALAVAAIATMVCLYQEIYLHFALDRTTTDNLVQAGVLGITFFIISILFQVLYKQLRKKDRKIQILERVQELEGLTASTKQELEESNSRMQALLNSAGDGVLGLEADGTISFANLRAGLHLHKAQDLLLGANIQDFLLICGSGLEEETLQEAMWKNQNLAHFIDFGPSRPQYQFSRWKTADGEPFYVEYSCEVIPNKNGEKNGVVVVFKNVTERRNQDEKLHRLANFDNLTGLANRTHFQDFLDGAVARAERSQQSIAVLFLDMDNFKHVNDTYGHEAGDKMLKVVADRISKRIRSGEMAARIGGDEFAAVLLDLDDKTNASLVAQSILDEVRQPIDVLGTKISGSLSIGIAALGPSMPSQRGSDLLKSADAAMYASKAKGGGCYHYFESDMHEEEQERRRVQKLLNGAIGNDEFKLLYQPIVDLSNNRVRSAEALLRWQPSNSLPILPGVFVPIAESSGQINEIGQWVVRKVFSDLRAWYELHGVYPRVAINISTRQLRTGEFRAAFYEGILSHNIPPEQVELELTETAVIDDPKFVMAELNRIHDMGVKIAIDDFGTGYSSLDYLRRLPLDYLKIDRSFTLDIGRSENAEELIRVMVAIGHNLGLQIVAEGVETFAQLHFLRGLGCDFGQGYLFGRPMSLDDAFSEDKDFSNVIVL